MGCAIAVPSLPVNDLCPDLVLEKGLRPNGQGFSSACVRVGAVAMNRSNEAGTSWKAAMGSICARVV